VSPAININNYTKSHIKSTNSNIISRLTVRKKLYRNDITDNEATFSTNKHEV